MLLQEYFQNHTIAFTLPNHLQITPAYHLDIALSTVLTKYDIWSVLLFNPFILCSYINRPVRFLFPRSQFRVLRDGEDNVLIEFGILLIACDAHNSHAKSCSNKQPHG